jgi:preprotein translocase subunit YajC
MASIDLTARFENMSLNGFRYLMAQQQTMPDPTGQNIKFFMMMGVVLVVMWVLMIAPQRKKAKELEAMLKALKPGDKIITSSGIIGVVLTIKDKSVSIRSAETKLEILKSAISDVTERSGESSESSS